MLHLSRQILAVPLAIAFAGCGINPATKRPEPVVISKSAEEKIGAKQHVLITTHMGLDQNRQRAAYVRAIGEKLAVHSPRQDVTYRFFVVDMPEANAFALPGGYVYVTRGLLALTNSEDELANVIGHEIAHVAARHANQRVVRAIPFAVVFGIPSAITGWIVKPVGSVIGGVGQFAGGVFLAPYSRSQEAGADKLGQQLAAQAGYDPAGMSSFMTTLGRQYELMGGDPKRTPFFATHPSPEGRAKKTAARAQKLERAPHDPVAPSHAAFLGKLKGLLVGLSGKEGVFVENRFLHAVMDFSVEFPEGWQTHNAPKVVAAVAEGEAAMLALSLVAEGTDPVVGGQQVVSESKLKLVEPIVLTQINDIPAARAKVETGGMGSRVSADMTWIAYRGSIFQITGATRPGTFAQFQPAFRRASSSFRPAGADRAKVTESRMQIVKANRGEKLEALAKRSESSWSSEELAVGNAWQVSEPLTGGKLVKVPVPQRFRPDGRATR